MSSKMMVKNILLPAAFGVLSSSLTGCTVPDIPDNAPADEIWETFQNLRGQMTEPEYTVWEDTNLDDDRSCYAPPEDLDDNNSMCVEKKGYETEMYDDEGNPLTCCQYYASHHPQIDACDTDFGKNHCQKSCWVELGFERSGCVIDNWDDWKVADYPKGGVDDPGSCWALYTWNALLEGCVNSGKFTQDEKDKLWDGEELDDGFTNGQLNCLTGKNGDNVVQKHKQNLLEGIVDQALNCPSTRSLFRFAGALETLRKTRYDLAEPIFAALKKKYGFDVWTVFFATDGILDKLWYSQCFSSYDVNVCSV